MFNLNRFLSNLSGQEKFIHFVLLLLLGLIGYHAYKDFLVTNYKKETIGEIVEYRPKKGKGGCGIKYKYTVNGKEYFGNVGVYCTNIFEKNIGTKITVYYSSEKTESSQVDLGDLDKYRSTIYMVK